MLERKVCKYLPHNDSAAFTIEV